MPNYYEILKVNPAATETEINTAIDAQYNEWRRLVTHHEPDIVNQATQSIQTLEQIRSTLTNPDKRSAYDDGIGIKGVTAGLADPSLLLERLLGGSVMTPPSVKKETAVKPNETGAESLWACNKCGSANPPLSLNCFKCGTQLMRDCPECHEKRSLVKTGVCGSCGYRYEVALQRQELRSQIEKERVKYNAVKQEYGNISRLPASGSGCAITFSTFLILGGFGAAVTSGTGYRIDQTSLLLGVLAIFLGIILIITSRASANNKKKEKEINLQQLKSRITQIDSQINNLETELSRLQTTQ